MKLEFVLLGLFHVLCIFIFGFFFEYSKANPTGDYSMFQDVHVMVFVGFGFLMSFMSTNSYTSTGHSLVIASFSVIWSFINMAFWHRVVGGPVGDGVWNREPIGIDALVNADFCAASVLIAFGALIGRLSLAQALLMAFFQVVFYNINVAICVLRLGLADLGGSYTIHIFGAFFGLAVALVLDGQEVRKSIPTSFAYNKVSNTMAMVGTLFLWCFWPSFNAYFGGSVVNVQRAVVNTYLSLAASAITAVYVSIALNGKISITHVQNATIAGGVAIAASCNMLVETWGALIIGSIAGIVSTFAYFYLTPLLNKKVNLQDTCGVLSLHGIPGILGAIAAIIMAGEAANTKRYIAGGSPIGTIWPFVNAKGHSFDLLIGYQVAALCVTIGIAILTGAFTGLILRLTPSLRRFYSDRPEYEVDEVIVNLIPMREVGTTLPEPIADVITTVTTTTTTVTEE